MPIPSTICIPRHARRLVVEPLSPLSASVPFAGRMHEQCEQLIDAIRDGGVTRQQLRELVAEVAGIALFCER